MNTAGSDVDAGPTTADGAVRDEDVAASSTPRGLSNEPEKKARNGVPNAAGQS